MNHRRSSALVFQGCSLQREEEKDENMYPIVFIECFYTFPTNLVMIKLYSYPHSRAPADGCAHTRHKVSLVDISGGGYKASSDKQMSSTPSLCNVYSNL